MKGFSFVFLAFIVLVAVASTNNASAGQFQLPKIKVKEGTSTNWSGYAVPVSGGVTYARGTWKVPKVDCSVTSTGGNNTYSSVWVGIDGDNSNTVEQTGTEQDCINGVAQYSAWYEMYPKYPVNGILAVKPGDTITAEVQSLPNKKQFKLTLTNGTTGQSYSTTQKGQAARSSAEWIVEAPWSSGVLPLANFGTVSFSGAQATINGSTGSISYWTNDKIAMVTDSGVVKAQPTSLSGDGTAFSVAWLQR